MSNKQFWMIFKKLMMGGKTDAEIKSERIACAQKRSGRHIRSRVKKICMSAAGLERGLRARFGNQIELALFDDPHVKGGALL